MQLADEVGDNMTNRRKFIKYVTYAAGTLCLSNNGFAAFLFKDDATVESVKKEIASAIKGEVVNSSLILHEFTTDFGRVNRTEPALVVIPKNEADVKVVLKIASEQQVPVSVRGAGHSCFGQTLSKGGIVLARPSDKPSIKLENGFVTVDGHSSWMELEEFLNEQGYTSPVLTDYLDLSIGGTLSVGGYGHRSFRHRAQIDNVEELQLILPNGEDKTCSRKQNSDLFNYTLGGLGQLGIIRSATFKPIKFKKHSVIFYLHCRKLSDFIQGCEAVFSPHIEKEIDHFSAYVMGGSFVIEIAKSFTEDEPKDCSELEKHVKAGFEFYRKNSVTDYHMYIHQVREKWVNRYGSAYRLWDDYVFTVDGFTEFLNATSEKTEYQDPSILPAIYFTGYRNQESESLPFSLAQPGDSSLYMSAGFYYMVKAGNNKGKEKAQKQLQKNRDLAIQFGGRPYLYGCHYLGEKEKQMLYGNDYDVLKRLKKRYDPNHILNPEIFISTPSA